MSSGLAHPGVLEGQEDQGDQGDQAAHKGQEDQGGQAAHKGQAGHHCQKGQEGQEGRRGRRGQGGQEDPAQEWPASRHQPSAQESSSSAPRCRPGERESRDGEGCCAGNSVRSDSEQTTSQVSGIKAFSFTGGMNAETLRQPGGFVKFDFQGEARRKSLQHDHSYPVYELRKCHCRQVELV